MQPVFDVRPLSDFVALSMAQRRFSLVLMLIFAGVALLLAAVGIYGVMSYTVAQRTRRSASAWRSARRRRRACSMVAATACVWSLLGLALGVAGALALTRLVSSLLYGVRPSIPTFAIIAGALAAVAFAATVIPARRATRVDPMLALRAD